MGYFLDILGSFAIGGLVLLILFRFNQTMLSAANEKLLYNIAQLNTRAASEVIKYDFYKIGFRVDRDNIDVFLNCEESKLKYRTDIDNNGVMDTIEYKLSDTDDLEETVNPNDRLLWRKVNDGEEQIVTALVDFELAYRDSNGSYITPISSLSAANKRREIRSIDVYFYLESQDPLGDIYQGTEWRRNITLKNIY